MAKRSMSQPENSTGNSSPEPTTETVENSTPGTTPREETGVNETPETNGENVDETDTDNTDTGTTDPEPDTETPKGEPEKAQPKANIVAIKLNTELGGHAVGDTINVVEGAANLLIDQGHAGPA